MIKGKLNDAWKSMIGLIVTTLMLTLVCQVCINRTQSLSHTQRPKSIADGRDKEWEWVCVARAKGTKAETSAYVQLTAHCERIYDCVWANDGAIVLVSFILCNLQCAVVWNRVFVFSQGFINTSMTHVRHHVVSRLLVIIFAK